MDFKVKELIGEGSFTKAYYIGEGKAFIHSCCPVKRVMSMGLFPDSELFPKMECIGKYQYLMEYYFQPSSLAEALDPDQWVIYETLKSLNRVRILNERAIPDVDTISHQWIEVFKTLENKELQTTLIKALEACMVIGSDICFEIAPRNVAVKNGKLILLDVFFSKHKLNETIRYGRGLE